MTASLALVLLLRAGLLDELSDVATLLALIFVERHATPPVGIDPGYEALALE